MHDFPDEELGKVTPYGIYDLTANTGWVNVGTDHDTGAFAVASIRSWWNETRPGRLPRRPAPAGHRRLRRVQRLPAAAVEDRAGHVRRRGRPGHHRAAPATGNQQVEQNRAPAVLRDHHELARPLLVSHEVIIETISAVTTRTGLKVTAVLDTGIYPKGIRIPDKDMKAFEARHLQRHQFHGNWNYTIPADPPGDTTRPDEGN